MPSFASLAQSIVGLVALLAIAALFSENRRRISLRFVGTALALSFGLALILLKLPPVQQGLLALNAVVEALQAATREGTAFVFGYLGGASAPFGIDDPGATTILAFQVLPLILVISALSALFWYWRLLPFIVSGFSRLLERTLGIGGAVGLGAAANVFMGMIEAPLLIRPYLGALTRSELFAVLTTGLATVSGTVLVIYAVMLEGVIDGAIGHILTASILNVPAALLMARMMIPDQHATPADHAERPRYRSSMDAIARGAEDGLKLYLNIIALLIVVISLVKLANILLGSFAEVAGAPLSFERLAGWGFAPLVWCAGVPWSEAIAAGSLMGQKTILNEFIAYLALASTPEAALGDHGRIVMVYALCGFANFGSVGIMIAGVSTMVPERREEVVTLSLKALISGTLATLFTGGVVGLLI